MRTSTVPDHATPDLTACDREPIHVPGSIQPHGLLLIVEAASATVVAGAGDIEARLAPDWLGRPLAEIAGMAVAAAAADARATPGLIVAGFAGERFDVAISPSGGHLLVELEPIVAEPVTARAMLARLDAIATTFERAASLQELCECAAIGFRALTGFDRVMIYRFLDDDAGRVVAEDRAPGLGTFLHHHFPATDIPLQARALYVRNRARAIPDIGYRPAPIRPAGFETIDLSDVATRSVSPIHLQYLRNMGVQASASISIVKDGILWGLIACHHDRPYFLPADLRVAASALAGGLARQVRAKEEAENYRERIRLRAGEDGAAARIGSSATLRGAVAAAATELMRIFDASGLAFVCADVVDPVGICPPAAEIADLAGWVRARSPRAPYASHSLGTLLPAAEAYREAASGLLAIPLSEDAMVLWFRAERVEEVEWAGNPHKAVNVDPNAVLTPRTSFASWSEMVHGRSRRWTLEEMEAAHRLRRTFDEAQQNRQLRELNGRLQRTLTEKDALIAQKEVLTKEVDHRVQNSLQLVSAFLALQARAAGPGEVARQLGEAQTRLAAVAQVHRRLYSDDNIASVDLSRYLADLVADMKVSLGPDWARQMSADFAPLLVPTDQAVKIGLILAELIINASKYAYAGGAGPIVIALEQVRNRLRLIVADKGSGRADASPGFGSRMMGSMVDSLAGSISYDDNRPGLRIILSAPVDAAGM